jgi:NTP pyrophosphatase (non-canonical NTP hydrolase)
MIYYQEATPYENAQHSGYGLMTKVGELLGNYKSHIFYKTPLDTKNLAEEVGDILQYISLGYYALGKEMPLTSPPLPKFNNDDLNIEYNLNKILAKLGHHAGNIFSVVLMYPDSWLIEQVDYDLDRMCSYLAIFIEKELGYSWELLRENNLINLINEKKEPENE